MHIVIRGVGAAILAAAVAGCALIDTAADERRAAVRVIEAYRLDSMLQQAAPIVTDAVMGNLPAGPDKAARERLRRAIADVYDAQTLKSVMAERLVAWAESQRRADELHTAADQLETDLAADMIAREDSAGDEDFNKGFQEFLDRPATDASDREMDRMRALAEDLQLVDLQTAFNLGMMQGMILAKNTVVSDDYSISPSSERMMLEETRGGLQRRLNQQIPVMLMYVYRDVGESRKAAYAELQHAEALRWVNGALADALETALKAAAERIPKRYAELESREAS